MFLQANINFPSNYVSNELEWNIPEIVFKRTAFII